MPTRGKEKPAGRAFYQFHWGAPGSGWGRKGKRVLRWTRNAKEGVATTDGTTRR